MDFFENKKIDRIFDIIQITLVIITLGLITFMISLKQTSTNNYEDSANNKEILEENKKEEEQIATAEEKKEEKIFVDIKGAIKKPGVYQVSIENIINDVIKLAGGLKANASTKYINLSKKVSNEMVITIFTNYQVSKMVNPTNEICKTTSENLSNCSESSIIETENSSNKNTTNPNEEKNTEESNNLVSLNKATKEELMTLTGIGESKADAIIEYRIKNNGFKKLEELMNISGIGEKAYSKIKDNITL